MIVSKVPPKEWLKENGVKVRIIRGKIILSRESICYTMSNSPEAVKARDNFGMAVRFVKNLLCIPALYEIWNKKKPDEIKTVHNYVTKVNLTASADDRLIEKNILIPGDGFHLPLSRVHVDKENVEIRVDNLDNILDPLKVLKSKMKFSIAGVIMHYDSIRRRKLQYDFTILEQKPELFKEGEPVSFISKLSPGDQKTAKKFRKRKLYLALIIYDVNGTIIHYSSPAVREI